MTALVAPSLQIQSISSLPELEGLRGEWESLWLHGDAPTPFQSPAWLLPWWKTFGAGHQLLTFAFRERDELVGLAPLYLRNERRNQSRELLWMGTGISDWLSPLCATPRFGPIVAKSLRQALFGCASQWDICDLQQLPPKSPLLAVNGQAGFKVEITRGTNCPAIDLWNERSRARAEKMAARAETYKRRLKLRGETHIVAAQKADFPEHYSAFLRLHRAEWRARGETGMLSSEGIQQFHQQAASELLSLSCLRLYSLYFNDRIVASFYGFADGRQVYYYLGGFDAAFSAFSPGTILIGHAVRAAIESGACGFDFLRGSEPYKYTWGAADRVAFRVIYRSNGARARG